MTTKLKILNLFALVLLFCLLSSAQSLINKADLHGQVVSDYGLPIPNAELVFESRAEYIKIKTDEHGKYTIKLYPHTYYVRINEWRGKLNYPKDSDKEYLIGNSYFRPMQRARFQLDKGQITEMNFVLAEVERSLVNEDVNVSNGDYEIFSVPTHNDGNTRPRYETLLFAKNEFNNTRDNRDDLDLMIQFSTRIEKGNTIKYLPANGYRFLDFHNPKYKEGEFFPGVIVTYNLYTIYMKEATFDKNKLPRSKLTGY